MRCRNQDCVILGYQKLLLRCISLSRAKEARVCILDLVCGFQLVTPSVSCFNSYFHLTASTEDNREALHHQRIWPVFCLFVFQLTINKWYISKIPCIFCFAISIVLLKISVDVLLIYHPSFQKDDIPFPLRVESALFSAYNPPVNTSTAICIGQ